MHDARDRNQGIWIEHNDRLYVAAYSSVASLVVTFSGYFRKMSGDIIEYAVTVNPTSDRAVTAGNQHFGAGFLLSCVATLASGSANRGQCYVRAQVQRSTGTPAVKLHNVVGGYLSDDYSPSFPYGKIEGPLEGSGALRSILGSDPAAGVEISETVPTGARWRLRAMRAVLTTDITIASRYPEIVVDDGTTVFFRSPSSALIIADRAIGVSVLSNANFNYALSTDIDIQIPADLQLLAGWRVRTSTFGIVAGDNWAAPQMLVEEWIEA